MPGICPISGETLSVCFEKLWIVTILTLCGLWALQKVISFDWYTRLELESIDSWEKMEQEFLNRFYSIQYIVSMTEQTNTKRWKDELMLDYINLWCTLSLKCKDILFEAYAVQMCTQDMAWDLLYNL